jgi:hypothetical protein
MEAPRLAAQVGRGEPTSRSCGTRSRALDPRPTVATPPAPDADDVTERRRRCGSRLTGKSRARCRCGTTRGQLTAAADAVEAWSILRVPDVVSMIGSVDRVNLAKYLTIAKLRLENAIAMVRSEGP